jgi:hypothetical protein
MNKSQRIYLSTGDTGNRNQDKYIKVKLDQDVETLEFMSLKIGTADIYQNFNSDYGVLVGRVIANKGIGIPNAKISIFIPLTEEDALNSDIYSIYPYSTPRIKNNEGKKYNLLPRVSTKDPNTELITPQQSFGSFPTKEEILANKQYLDIYKKYYKYTALTNSNGDYMIFGVPVGTQTVHLSVDITDIGEYSMTPAAMVINLGYSPNLFTNNNTRIKPSKDLVDLPHIETQEISVDIIPFWGDVENFEIGITRQDFRIRAELNNTFTIFGSIFTDAYESRWAANWESDNQVHAVEQLYRINKGDNYKISSKRIGNITEKIYYYPNNISDTEINENYYTEELAKKMLVLDKSQYTIHKNDGEFVFIINCNRKKIIENEVGDPIEVDDSYDGGVYTEFKGFITLEITEEDLSTPNKKYDNAIGSNNNSVTVFRTRIKIPQHAPRNKDFSYYPHAFKWNNQHYTFKANEVYSVAKFNGLVANTSGSETGTPDNGFENSDTINKLQFDPNWNVGVVVIDDDNEFPSNGTTNVSTTKAFGSNWLNFSIYLPNIGYVVTSDFGNMKTNSYFQRYNGSYNDFFTNNNERLIADGIVNNKWYLRSDLHWTDFIKVPKTDIKILNNFNKKGFDNTTDNYLADNLKGDYRNGKTPPSWGGDPCPIKGGGNNGNPVSNTNSKDDKFYFYKGFDSADSIKFVASILNI